MFKIKSIKLVSLACPTQWEGSTECKRFIYIRFRHGAFTVQLSKPKGTLDDAVRSIPLFKYTTQDLFDGWMDTTEMISLTKTIFDFSDIETKNLQYKILWSDNND